MFHLLFVSSVSPTLQRDELMRIMDSSCARNEKLGLTGLLLYKGGNFMQLLEGDESAVRRVFASIQKDRRHHDVTVLVEQSVTERLFANWSMGFRDVNDADIEGRPGLAQFLSANLSAAALRSDPSGCLDLLKFFALER